jgi:cytochrome bd-type quinol oxidase subunit 2
MGYTIPIIVIIVFTGLLLGIFFDVSRDYAGNELFKNYWVAVVMGAFFLLLTFYAFFVVPMLKQKGEERTKTRVKRRPGKA